MSVCEKHKRHPAKIYDQCVGCEIEWYQNKILELEKELMVLREAPTKHPCMSHYEHKP